MTAITTRPPLSDSTDSLLRFALRADATLTGLFGLGVAAAAGSVSTLTGLTAAQAFALGAALVVYGLVVYSLAALPSLRAVGIGVAIANVVCTLACVVVVAAGTPSLTQAGVIVTLAMAVYTGFFAWLQYLGVRRLA
ncbi:hypothetical protein [Mycobacterium hubeiense]|uniref:hypothetical protein n=1 Tax=Mycobacterium hubeiense TaxID=1867256 RepID=UPI000C7E9DFA|nr:hypothetical protein [Mycobacterium sp. QGD 101]